MILTGALNKHPARCFAGTNLVFHLTVAAQAGATIQRDIRRYAVMPPKGDIMDQLWASGSPR